MPKQFQKFLVALVIFCFACPSLALGAGEFELVTRVKNITAGDNASGAIYTMAQAGDEMRNLAIITNRENYERDYTVTFNLPDSLIYQEGSLEKNQGSWQPANNILSGSKIHLMPNETVFLRFTSKVANDLQNENLILGVETSVTDNQNVQMGSVTKIYIPNFNAEQDLNIEGITDEEKAELKKIYEEEKSEIEQTFEKERAGDEEANTTDTESEMVLPTDVVNMFNLYIGAVIASIILVYLIYKYVRKN